MEELEHHALVQAPVDPVDEDGVAAAYVGTVVSALATLVLWWQYGWLEARNQSWWLWVGISATASGVLFSAYTSYRKRRRLSPVEEPASVEQ